MMWTFWKKAQPKTVTINTPDRIELGDFVVDTDKKRYRIVKVEYHFHAFTYTGELYTPSFWTRLKSRFKKEKRWNER
jgi:hypothetical protein